MSKAKHYFNKYRIRFGFALIGTVAIEAMKDEWSWNSLALAWLATCLVIVLSNKLFERPQA